VVPDFVEGLEAVGELVRYQELLLAWPLRGSNKLTRAGI
jgi:hypothetical protein